MRAQRSEYRVAFISSPLLVLVANSRGVQFITVFDHRPPSVVIHRPILYILRSLLALGRSLGQSWAANLAISISRQLNRPCAQRPLIFLPRAKPIRLDRTAFAQKRLSSAPPWIPAMTT